MHPRPSNNTPIRGTMDRKIKMSFGTDLFTRALAKAAKNEQTHHADSYMQGLQLREQAADIYAGRITGAEATEILNELAKSTHGMLVRAGYKDRNISQAVQDFVDSYLPNTPDSRA